MYVCINDEIIRTVLWSQLYISDTCGTVYAQRKDIYIN